MFYMFETTQTAYFFTLKQTVIGNSGKNKKLAEQKGTDKMYPESTGVNKFI